MICPLEGCNKVPVYVHARSAGPSVAYTTSTSLLSVIGEDAELNRTVYAIAALARAGAPTAQVKLLEQALHTDAGLSAIAAAIRLCCHSPTVQTPQSPETAMLETGGSADSVPNSLTPSTSAKYAQYPLSAAGELTLRLPEGKSLALGASQVPAPLPAQDTIDTKDSKIAPHNDGNVDKAIATSAEGCEAASPPPRIIPPVAAAGARVCTKCRYLYVSGSYSMCYKCRKRLCHGENCMSRVGEKYIFCYPCRQAWKRRSVPEPDCWGLPGR